MNPSELLQGVRDAISVRRVFGDPIEHDGVVVIPVARVGGGGGGGGDSEGNGGGGFGLAGRPAGVYVIKDRQVSWRPAVDPLRLAALAVLAVVLWRRASR